MSSFFWRIFKYVLWFAFFVVLWWLFFWLIKFKFDYKAYISYLNAFDISQFVSGYINNKFMKIEDIVLIENTGLNLTRNTLTGDNLDIYDSSFEDGFMQNTGSISGLSTNEVDYWFKPVEGSLSGNISAAIATWVSKKQLLDLIKSEK